MQKARAFFYVSLGILALAGAFALGAQTVQGQGSSPVAAGLAGLVGPSRGWQHSVVLENGDVWGVDNYSFAGGPPPQFIGNIFTGAPIQTTSTTWGRIKADRR